MPSAGQHSVPAASHRPSRGAPAPSTIRTAISGWRWADDVREHAVDPHDAESQSDHREQRGETGGESRRTDGLHLAVRVWMSDIGTCGSRLQATF